MTPGSSPNALNGDVDVCAGCVSGYHCMEHESNSIVEGLGRLTTERQIALAILEILFVSPNGEASLSDIKIRIPRFLNLTDNDRQMSKSRPSEQCWEQRLRNVISHYKTKGNVIYEGLIVQTNRGKLKLTRKGRSHLTNRREFENGFDSTATTPGRSASKKNQR